MLTSRGYIDGIYVTIYSSTIDPMGSMGHGLIAMMIPQHGFLCWHHPSGWIHGIHGIIMDPSRQECFSLLLKTQLLGSYWYWEGEKTVQEVWVNLGWALKST